jgi:hypothetical protein
MVDKEYTEEEKLFRENYTQELRKKQQAMKTPRRRGSR